MCPLIVLPLTLSTLKKKNVYALGTVPLRKMEPVGPVKQARSITIAQACASHVLRMLKLHLTRLRAFANL